MDKNIKNYTKNFFKKNKLNFIFSLSECALSIVGALVVAWLLQQIIDLISGENNTFTLLQLLIISVVVVIGLIATYLISMCFKPRFIYKGISQYKEYVYQNILKKNIGAFLGEDSSKYLSSLTNDINTIEKGYLLNIYTIITNVFIFFGALGLMLYYSPLLTLIAILFSLLPFIASILTGKGVANAEKEVSNENEKYTSTLKDVLSGFSVIKSFRVEKEMIKIFKDNIKRLAKAQTRKLRLQIIIEMLGNASGYIVQLGVFIFGAYLALSGRGVTAGITIAFVQLLNFVIGPIGAIPTALAERKAAKALITKIATALDENIREEKESNIDKLNEGITIKDLSFGYSDEKIVLNNISYNFELGKKYAIVGTSGSGKSTLLNLLMASSSNYSGDILYDGVDLKDINSSNLYEIESIIQQNVFIFNGTILDNITMYQSFSEEEINNAINMSGLRDLVNEKGMDYNVGENGKGLSGGEKQRISIARSLLRKSQVLLVDEATAALDKETAFNVSNAIIHLEGVTSIVVTHSLEEGLLKEYDKIITLKNGSIIEDGSFEELLNNKGYFYSLYTISQN